jgi:hypothetical protein
MENTPRTVVVTGPPRSGTSLLMQMLHASGIEVIADEHRPQDIDNPRGYFEHEQVKNLAHDHSPLLDSAGKAIKVIHVLLGHIPRELPLAVLFLERDLDEVLASQAAMLARLNRAPQAIAADRMRNALARQLAVAREHLKTRPSTVVMNIEHRVLIDQPQQTAERIAEFLAPALCRTLDAEAMAQCVDPSLYRQKNG